MHGWSQMFSYQSSKTGAISKPSQKDHLSIMLLLNQGLFLSCLAVRPFLFLPVASAAHTLFFIFLTLGTPVFTFLFVLFMFLGGWQIYEVTHYCHPLLRSVSQVSLLWCPNLFTPCCLGIRMMISLSWHVGLNGQNESTLFLLLGNEKTFVLH